MNATAARHPKIEGLGRYYVRGMPYYASQAKRTAQLTVRVPKSVYDSLLQLAKFWTEVEKAQTGDPDTDVNLSDVVNRLLSVGLDGAWGEVGGRPADDSQFAKLVQVAVKQVAKK